MVRRFGQFMVLGAIAALLAPTVARAQFPSEVVSFEDGCADDSACKEVFRAPSTSGSTQGIVPNVAGEDNNGAFRTVSPFGASEGSVAYQVFWSWLDASDPSAWVRLTTIATPTRPNPSLDTSGKVRFKIQNIGEFAAGEIGLCIGIRETGNDVPQLADGGASGSIEWVGVDPTINAIVEPDADGNGTADTEVMLGTDDVQVTDVGDPVSAGDVIIGPGPNNVVDTPAAGDEVARFGYFRGTGGARIPIPAVTVPVAAVYRPFEVDLATGNVSFDGVTTPGAIVSFSGNGVLDAPNNRGTLEHLAITNVTTDTATSMLILIDELQFEATVPDPVPPPSVAFPIVNGDATITVNNVLPIADEVRLYRDGIEVTPSIDPNGATSVMFDITGAEAVTGEEFIATQRVGGVTSPDSAAVEVLSAAPPYTISTIIDETGSGSCSTLAPGWEWVGVTSVVGVAAPQGMTVLTDDAVWQTIDIPLNDDNLILPTSGIVGGDGALGASPTGFYTLDSLWFTAAPLNAEDGPWEVFIDKVTYLDGGGVEAASLMSFEDGVNRFPLNRGQSSTLVTSTALSTLASYDGQTSHRLTWTYTAPVDNTDAMGMLQRVGSCGTSIEIPDTATAIRMRMVLRGQPTAPGVPLPSIVGPIVVGSQNTVRVLTDTTATEVQLYVDGAPVGAPVALSNQTSVDIGPVTLSPGQSISATQVAGTVSDFAYPKAVSAKSLPPTVASPILPGATSVTVNNVLTAPLATASVVTVYINNVAQTPVATGGAASVNVTIPAAVPLQSITATQTVNGVESDQSAAVVVAVPAPVLYWAPAQGDDTVRVTGVNSASTEVRIIRNGVTVFSSGPLVNPPATVDVTGISGLVTGDVVTARQVAAGTESLDSVAETVTIDTVAQTIWCDSFEYADQAAFNALWTAVAPSSQLILSTAKNATIGGAKSMSAPAAPPNYRTSRGTGLTPATPTDTNPVVWNVTIYDPSGGPGPLHYADLNNNAASAQLCEIGMTNLGPSGLQTHYQARIVGNGGPNWIHLNQFDGPTRSVGFHVFTMVFKGPRAGNAAGHEVDMYVDGKLGAKNVLMTTTALTLREPRLGSSFATPVGSFYDDYCAEVGPVRFNEVTQQPPNPPVFTLPITDGDLSVHLTGIDPTATLVEVFVAGNPTAIGSIDPMGATAIDVPVTELEHLQLLSAVATNAVGTSLSSLAWEVGKGNGDILLTLGVRDSGDAGALGTPGSTSAVIEWIGATSVVSNAPQGIPISPSASWQTVTFDPAGTIFAFPGSGNGVLNNAKGTIEHLALTMNSASANRSSGGYVIYIDNVVNVGAGVGGADFVIEDFEDDAEGTEVLFQEPTFSGTTSANMAPTPSSSENSLEEDNGGLASQKLQMVFRDTGVGRYARITTSGVATRPSPIIDLTRPIRMDVLLLDVVVATGACCESDGSCTEGVLPEACQPYVCDVAALLPPSFLGCFGDMDGNGVVNPADRGFVSANIGNLAFNNLCRFDVDGNGIINAGDRGFVSANIGLCQSLPNYQNGSGLNAAGDGPDARFPAAVFTGGATCAEVTCE